MALKEVGNILAANKKSQQIQLATYRSISRHTYAEI